MTGAAIADHPGWSKLLELLEALPASLADLRSPPARRFGALARIARDLEATALELTGELIAIRNRRWPDPAAWRVGRDRHPQPDPTLLLAVREWVLSLGLDPRVALDRQKRLGAVLTEILVARAAVLVYSKRLHQSSPSGLVRTLDALWMLVAECWRLRPLLSEGSGTTHA